MGVNISLRKLFEENASSLILIILNRPITLSYFDQLWDRSRIKICADGGCNALFRYSKNLIPDYIIGDMDSIDKSSLEYYREKLPPDHIIFDESQEDTDMEKSCKYVIENNNQLNPDAIVVVGGQGGPRWDHSFGALHCCCRWVYQRIILCEEGNVCFGLPAGKDHELEIDLSWEGPCCGIFPMEGVTRVITKGLKWDLNENEPITMGKRVSVSNVIQSQTVFISNDKTILWTEEFHPKFTLQSDSVPTK